MRTEQIRYFLETVKTGSFTRAAENLHIQPPSLRESITNLENELGQPLFIRSKKGIYLNQYGLMCLPYLQNMMEIYDKLTSGTVTDAVNKRNILNMEVQDVYGTWSLVLQGIFQEQFPYHVLRINTNNNVDKMFNHLSMQKSDVVFMVFADDEKKKRYWEKAQLHNLKCVSINKSKVHVLMQKNHPLAVKKTISFKDFYKHPLVFNADYAPMYEVLEKRLNMDECDPIMIGSYKLARYYCQYMNALYFITGEAFEQDDVFVIRPLAEDVYLEHYAFYGENEMITEIMAVINAMRTAMKVTLS